MFEYTGCDAIMIGRGCLGNPWLIRDLVNYFDKGIIMDKPSYEERIMMCLKHMDYLSKIKPEKVCVLEMRSHIAWYIKGMPRATDIKKQLMKLKTINEVKKLMDSYLKDLKNSI